MCTDHRGQFSIESGSELFSLLLTSCFSISLIRFQCYVQVFLKRPLSFSRSGEDECWFLECFLFNHSYGYLKCLIINYVYPSNWSVLPDPKIELTASRELDGFY